LPFTDTKKKLPAPAFNQKEKREGKGLEKGGGEEKDTHSFYRISGLGGLR